MAGLKLKQRDSLMGYLFIAPQLLGFLAFVLGPLLAVFVFSFQSRNLLTGQVTFIGLDNYRQMLASDPLFLKVLGNSLIFMLGLVPLNMVLALGLALLLARNLAGSTIFRTVFFSPVVTSTVAWVIVWRFVLQGEQGSLNQFLQLFGIQGPNWLQEPFWAMTAVVVTRVLKNVGLNIIIFLAAIKDLPKEYVEAASVDGANPWQTLRHIILPFLAPTIMLVTVVTVIGSLNVLDHIMLLTGGGPSNATMVLAYYVYYAAFRIYETGYASTLAVVLFLTALLLTLVQWGVRKQVVYNER
ncbi:MAG: sugar ABC transporter permease [Anaerolineae bacterium]|nr:sugar ABC transporter permease [Anaerolineae bacterium]